MGRTYAAAQLGVSDDTLGRYEAGTSDPTYRQVVALAVLYGVPVESFVEASEAVA